MDKFDITKIDLFSLKEEKRGELLGMHSVLLFLYHKRSENSSEVKFNYSEVSWLDRRVFKKFLEQLAGMGLITLGSIPKHHSRLQNTSLSITLKTNEELQLLLNRNKILSLHNYKPNSFTKINFAESLSSEKLREHFQLNSVIDWIRNVTLGSWDLAEFLIVAKLISLFDCDQKIKTASVQKYMAQKSPFLKGRVKFLYEKIALNKREVLSLQLKNTLKILGVKSNKSFLDMVEKYVGVIKSNYCL